MNSLSVENLMSVASSMSSSSSSSLTTSSQLGSASSISDLLASVSSTSTSSSTSSLLSISDANAYTDYLNSSYSSLLSSDTDTSSVTGSLTDYVSSDGLDSDSYRTSYLKQWFPNMSDEQIASLNSYYDTTYSSLTDSSSSSSSTSSISDLSSYISSDGGVDADSYRTTYIKQLFPDMSDEQVASMNSYYNTAYSTTNSTN